MEWENLEGRVIGYRKERGAGKSEKEEGGRMEGKNRWEMGQGCGKRVYGAEGGRDNAILVSLSPSMISRGIKRDFV